MTDIRIVELEINDHTFGYVIKSCKLTLKEQIECMYSLINKTFWTNLQRFMEYDIPPPKKKWPYYKINWNKKLVRVNFFNNYRDPFCRIESEAETGYYFCPILIGYDMQYKTNKDMVQMVELFDNKKFCENYIVTLMLLYCFEKKNFVFVF